MAIKRIYAHEKIYDALCEALADEATQVEGRRRPRSGDEARADPEPHAVRQGAGRHRGHEEASAASSSPAASSRRARATS